MDLPPFKYAVDAFGWLRTMLTLPKRVAALEAMALAGLSERVAALEAAVRATTTAQISCMSCHDGWLKLEIGDGERGAIYPNGTCSKCGGVFVVSIQRREIVSMKRDHLRGST